jgi:hypothetical protein
MDLSLLIFTLEIHQFCMKCIEFTTRTYNFKKLAVGSLIWGAKTGVNSSYFPQQISTCPVLCCILKLSPSHVDWVCKTDGKYRPLCSLYLNMHIFKICNLHRLKMDVAQP